jgi:hypothetical protein
MINSGPLVENHVFTVAIACINASSHGYWAFQENISIDCHDILEQMSSVLTWITLAFACSFKIMA